ncbi:beta-ketoacyl synthase chain length factor [Pseudomonas sp. RIT-PI-S]|uniref:beta-ketoacyl synthase chain length factor n=1 Tax=Pseudomonas sp. RIT-PI-S TaxID=3035295 RepID=UPI0021D8D48D|nr:beta-ketoacyl synthase chain length factor [Pseudomonas sp. RIT-PI-S]
MDAVFSFDIAHWRAWAPGLSSAEDWLRWSADRQAPADEGAAPDVSFLPAMQRRRLSRLARMVFHVGWPLAEGYDRLPFIFVSRHGETPRTFEMLADLARNEPLSPTQFSLSVHNAVIGLWSILRGETSEMTALAAQGDGLEHGMLEAAALLAEGAPAVLLVLAEEQPPAPYEPWVDDVPFAYAIGLLVTPGNGWCLNQAPAGQATATSGLPHGLSLLSALAAGHTTLHHRWKHRAWTWQSNQ